MPPAAPIAPDAAALAYVPAEAASVSQGRGWLQRPAKRAIDVIVAGVTVVLLCRSWPSSPARSGRGTASRRSSGTGAWVARAGPSAA